MTLAGVPGKEVMEQLGIRTDIPVYHLAVRCCINVYNDFSCCKDRARIFHLL
ncbi:hypothetical protein D3C87_459200 [compost metagenome]